MTLTCSQKWKLRQEQLLLHDLLRNPSYYASRPILQMGILRFMQGKGAHREELAAPSLLPSGEPQAPAFSRVAADSLG